MAKPLYDPGTLILFVKTDRVFRIDRVGFEDDVLQYFVTEIGASQDAKIMIVSFPVNDIDLNEGPYRAEPVNHLVQHE